MSSCFSTVAHSHQLKSNERKVASFVVFTYAVLCGITDDEESRVQVLPGVDPPSLKTTIKVSHPPITSLPPLLYRQTESDMQNSDFSLSPLAPPSLVGWQCPTGRKGS